MSALNRRQFIRSSLAAGAALAVPSARILGANNDIRLGVIGVGSRVKIGGMGRNEIAAHLKIPGVRFTALCDCDKANLMPEVEKLRSHNPSIKAYTDLRELLDDKNVDAVIVTTPNHWHALATIWACQAGKDVYVQKPTAHTIFEGRRMVEAAAKVQTDRPGPARPARADRIRRSVRVRPQGQPRQGPLRPRAQLQAAREHRQGQRPAADSRNASTTTSGAARPTSGP